MKMEEYDQLFVKAMQGLNATVEHIPPKKASSGTRKVQFLMVKYPPSQPTSPCESAEAGDDSG